MLQAVRLLTELARFGETQRNEEMEGQSTSTEVEGTIQFREIHKNGWLRRTDKSDKEQNRFWVAFCIHTDTEPRLEGFTDQKQATAHSPLWAQSLRGVLHLSPTLCATPRNDYEFCVNFTDNRVLRLAAPTYQTMCDWVQVITRKLTDMKIVKPKENVYSKGPERLVTRDPTSPLPPPPVSSGSAANQRAPQTSDSVVASTSNALQAREDTSPAVFTFDDVIVDERRSRSAQPHRVAPPVPSPRVIPTPVTSNDETSNSSYESVFLASSYSPTWEASLASDNDQGDNSNDHYVALMQYRSSDRPESRGQIGEETRTAASNSRRQLTLREKQILELKKEMSHPAGVRLQLGRRDCKDSIAFVDAFGAVWVAGWKQREHPLLYNVLHVGDLVLSVAGVTPSGAGAVKDILKNCTSPRVEIIVRRLPYARAMTLRRANDTEDFGLEVNGNEVTGVSGIALSAGLTATAAATDLTLPLGTVVTWTLTEVNGRPLNMFEGGARERLSAVGRDISLVIQPTDLVASIRKKLRALRSYKQYVVQ